MTMYDPISALMQRVQADLARAGFQIVDGSTNPFEGGAGLRVRTDGGGVVIKWSPSDAFDALAGERAQAVPAERAGDYGMRMAVRLALTHMFMQLGYTVTERPDSGEIVIRQA